MATRITFFPELLVGIRKPSTDQFLNAGTVTFYEAGTTTLKTVYNDAGGTSAADNPKTLDAYGSARVFGEGIYKLVIKDSLGNVVWTWDNYKLRYYNVDVSSKSASYQATTQNDLILVDTSGGDVTITLPQASTATIPLYIKKISSDANSVIVAAYAGDLVDGAASVTFSAQNYTAVYFSDGSSNWYGSADTTNATTLGGYSASQTPTASTIVVSQSGSTYIHDDWINWAVKAGAGLTYAASAPTSGALAVVAGIAIDVSSDAVNVKYDDVNIGVNGSNQLYFKGTIGQSNLGANSVGQSQLKTATASQSQSITGGSTYAFTPTGGDYTLSWFLGGHAINLRVGGNAGTYAAQVGVFNSAGAAEDAYLYSRYVQASPPYKLGETTWGHFCYILRNISTGEIVGSYEAEDPMWAYNGDFWLPKDSDDRIKSFPHPFTQYFERNPADDGLEIVLVDMRDFDVKAWKVEAKKRKKNSILDELATIVKPSGQYKAKEYYGITKTITGFTDIVKFKTRE